MLVAKGRHWLAVLLSICIVTVAYSNLTVSDSDRMFAAYPASVSSDAAYVPFYEFGQIGEFPDPQIRAVAEKLLNPPLLSSYSAQASNLKSLPAVPATVFMVLTGFVCVSLVKDRKLWLAALTGLFWLSQTSVTALPKLASHLYSKKQIEQSAWNVTSSFEFNSCSRLRYDVEGKYIGLLRRLAAIPQDPATSFWPHLSILPRITLWLKLQQRNTQYAILASGEAKVRNTRYAICNTKYLILSTQNSKLKTQNSIHKMQLARGPPLLT